jgi:hypothetical protein
MLDIFQAYQSSPLPILTIFGSSQQTKHVAARELAMAIRRKLEHDDLTRQRIKAAQIINRLQACINGTVKLSSEQIRCAEILLRKCLPDLIAAEVASQVTHRFCVIPDTLPQDEWLATRGQGYGAPEPKKLCPDAMGEHNVLDLAAEPADDDKGKLN